MSHYNFFAADIPSGGGKTHAAAAYMIELANKGQKCLIAQPTIKLIRQTQRMIRAQDPDVKLTVITSQGAGFAKVASRIHGHITQARPDQGEILIITHEALFRFPRSHHHFWHLFVDEVPTVFHHRYFRIAETHELLTSHLDVTSWDYEGLSVVKAKPGLAALSNNQRDDEVWNKFQDVANDILDPDRLVFVHSDNYADLLTGKNPKGEVSFFSILMPSYIQGFITTTFLSANFVFTQPAVIWGKLSDIAFKRHEAITGRVKYTTHHTGGRLTINYLLEDNWSSKLARIPDQTTGEALQTEINRIVEEFFRGQHFLWINNESISDDFLDSQQSRLPGYTHGLNKPEYINCQNIALLGAYNFRPPAYKFFRALGISNEEARAMLCYQLEYQALMRCNIRDENSQLPVNVVVVGKGSADFLHDRFPGSQVVKLPHQLDIMRNPVGRPAGPTPPLTAAEKQRRYRERLKHKKDGR